jgi:trimeric autotransporter adhesin
MSVIYFRKTVGFISSNCCSRLLWQRSFIRVIPALICLGLCSVDAVSPPPDGGYPGGNTAEGDSALANLTNGLGNTAVGHEALENLTTGDANTAVGEHTLLQLTSGGNNTAIGNGASASITTGGHNTAVGAGALVFNQTGDNNTALGDEALFETTGFNNTAAGASALFNNTTGFDNTAHGVSSLFSNKTGFNNTATGFTALQNNTTGNSNTATGDGALAGNTSGNFNTACGISSLLSNTIGKNNTGIGSNSGGNLTTGNNNIAVGVNAGLNLTTGSNNIEVGNAGLAGEANTIRLGKQGMQKATFIAGIAGTGLTGAQVVVNSTGKLGVVTSSARFKNDIKPLKDASEAILKLKPVMFRYKKEIDPDAACQFGLVAEEVDKVMPELVIHDEEGKPFTVHYDAVNAMLLNEFLKNYRADQEQGRQLQEQELTIANLETLVKQQQKQIEALTATVLKVSERIEPKAALATP